MYESDEDIDGNEVMQYIMSSTDAEHSRQAACMTKMEVIKASTSGGKGDGESGVWRTISDFVLDDSLTIPAGHPEYGFMGVFDDIMTDDRFFLKVEQYELNACNTQDTKICTEYESSKQNWACKEAS